MRKIRIFEHMSLDGVIQPTAPDGNSDAANGDWTAPYRSPAGREAIIEAQGKNFDLLLGRVTYDLWASYWPTLKGPFADDFNAATKYVATHRPDTLAWKAAQALGPNVLEDIRRLKSQDGPDLLVWGSSTLTTLLLENQLVEEVILCIYPLLNGRGKRFYSDTATPCKLTLVSTKTTTTGVLLNTYRCVDSDSAKSS